MRKYFGYTLAFILILLSLSNCARPSQFNVKLGQEFNIYIGQTAIIDDENLSVEFSQVIEDNRCPSDVECVQAGKVSCIVSFTDTSLGTSSQVTLTQRGLTSQPATQTYKGYTISFNVEPYPISRQTIKQSAYHIAMTITRLAGT